MATDRNGTIAIIGIGCRMPPNANSLAAFWRFLLRGGNALRSIRKDRWDWRQFFDEDQKRPGKSYAPKAASLDMDLRQFDPLAFGISPREAASLDPQQRLLLESTWEAFEDAGVPLERVSGSATGVFVGGFCLDHLVLQTQPSNRHLVNAHSPGGVMMTVLSNRISHAFNLKGPSLTLDTACSSSLVALHYACQSLRLRECDMALAGGVNAMMRPEYPLIMSKGHFLSHHGECHAFDETAAGYARGEGAGLLLLKRCDEAVADGDQIHAIVRASGVNQDGHTDGISLPNSDAQEALVRQVYSLAGVPFSEVDYVEAHGTGTQAGDSAELGALHRNFSEGRTSKLIVGSVKTNIGHLEAAAGVAGLFKTIGILKNRKVPKNLHFKTPNPRIPFDEYCVEVAGTERTLSSAEQKPSLYAGVNSFGYGGTNAHVLLESAPETPVDSAPSFDRQTIIPFSACSEVALRDFAGKFAFLLGQPLPGSLGDLAYTAAFRRSHLPVRMTVAAATADELRDALIAASTGQPHPAVIAGGKAAQGDPQVVFVFTGMGPQWWGMGQELIRSEPVVAAAIDEIDGYFQKLAGWSLKEAMLADEAGSRMARTELAQPANFALQIALARLFEAHGVRPAAVVGHSVGEVSAACVAGVYTLEEAVCVSYHRSRLQQTAAGLGSMLAVGLSEEDALREIAESPGVSIAAINSFNAVTLSGDTAQLKQVAASLEQRGVFNKFLRVEVAYHSPQMDSLREDLLAALADLRPQPATLPLYSTAHGKIVPGEEWDAEYWWRNVRQPVRFAAAARQLMDDGYSLFLEVGPHPVLGNSIKECAVALGRKIACVTSLRRAEPERPQFLRAAGELYCAGVALDWRALVPAKGRFISGPQYPWQRQMHWVESERSKMERLGLPGSPYLNRSVLGPGACWEVEINRNYFPFLFDHRVQDQTVFPGMGYIDAALALSAQVHGRPATLLENVSFDRVLIADPSRLQVLMSEFDAEGGRFIISSRVEGEEDSVQRHCRGRMVPLAEPAPGKIDVAALAARCKEKVESGAFYERLRQRELNYGPMFRPVVEMCIGDGRFLLKIDTTEVAAEEMHPLHPVIFDAALQAVIYCASRDRLFIPSSFGQFEYFSRPRTTECFAYGEFIYQTETHLVANVWLADGAGNVCACARRLALQLVDTKARAVADGLFYDVEWRPEPLALPESGIEGAEVLVLADAGESRLAEELVALLPGSVQADMADFPKALEEHSARRYVVALNGANGARFDGGAALALCERTVALLQAAGARSVETDFTFVTRGAKPVPSGSGVANVAAHPLGAIALVAQNEFDNVTCRTVDLSPAPDAAAEALVREIAAGSSGEIAFRGGERFESVLRSRKDGKREETFVAVPLDEPLELRQSVKGRPDSLRFERATRVAPAQGEVEVRIHRVALNYKDLLKIEGHISPIVLEDTFWGTDAGMECAGIVERCGPGGRFAPGDRVAAILPRAFRSFATIPETFVVRIPDSLDMDAAGIPVVYMTAHRGLVEIANLQPGERVLIHHGTGGLGLAAINIAQNVGAEIFTTAGSEEKRAMLRELGIAHVFPSRGLDFGPQIRDATGGEGIDVVIGAQTGQAMHVSLGLLRTGGRYIEVGKKDIAEDNGLPMRAFNRNLVFASLDIDRLALERPEVMQRTMQAVFARFEAGDYRQCRVRTVPAAELREAFREMARSQHVGKVLVDFSSGVVEVVESAGRGADIRADGCYIVTGGTSGFGLATARWLVRKGAGRILLVSRSGMRAPGIEEAIAPLAGEGARVDVLSVDMREPSQVNAMVDAADQGPFTLRGVVHGAMVLDDAMLPDLTAERFRRVFEPKAVGALHLAEALKERAGLDFVIFHSSISAVVGNRGQTSYVAANALLDGVAHALRAEGIPATSVNWGALAESGVVARSEHLGSVLSSVGVTGLSDEEAFAALEQILERGVPQAGAFKVDWARWHEAHPRLANDPRFQALRVQAGEGEGSGAAGRVRAELADASREQQLRALEAHISEVLGTILKMATDNVPTDRRLNELGVDSLLVLELGLGIEERIGIRFSAMELLKGTTVAQLATLAHSRLWKA